MINKGDLLKGMVSRGIYEVHIVPGSPIMFRNKVGDLETFEEGFVLPADTKELVLNILNDVQKAEFVEKNELDFAMTVPGFSRYRFSVFMQRSSISMIIKTYPMKIPTLDELRLHKGIKEIILPLTKGLVLVTGPKGGGKSTTLAAVLNEILAQRPVKMLTVENPMRYMLRNQKGVVCQREIGIDVKDRGLLFDSLTNQSADVIVVDEVSCLKELMTLILLSAGGTIVFLKMISPSITHAVEKLLSMFPPEQMAGARSLIAGALEGGFSQVLCRHTDNKTLIPAMEVYKATNNMRQFIREDKLNQVYQVMGGSGRQLGMTNQEASLKALVKQNSIKEEEAMNKTSRPDEMKKLFASAY